MVGISLPSLSGMFIRKAKAVISGWFDLEASLGLIPDL